MPPNNGNAALAAAINALVQQIESLEVRLGAQVGGGEEAEATAARTEKLLPPEQKQAA